MVYKILKIDSRVQNIVVLINNYSTKFESFLAIMSID